MSSRKLLAVASNGGHLVQLMRLAPSFEGCDVVLVSTSPDMPRDMRLARYYCVEDSNFQQKARLLVTAWQVGRIVLRERPDTVISTGAAPGLLAMCWARLMRRKLIWIDSIANTDRLSLAGRAARYLTPLCFSQWPHVSDSEGVGYIGSVIPSGTGTGAGA